MPKPIPTFALVRHGVTPLNEAPKRIRAWGKEGIDFDKAKPVLVKTAQQLQQFKLVNPIYSSDLVRTMQSAQILADELLMEVLGDFGLRTWNLGNFEGQPSSEVEPRLAELIKHPGTPVAGGEPHAVFAMRWGGAFRNLVRRAMSHPEVVQVAVVHSSNIEAARDLAQGRRPDNIAFGDSVKPGEATLWRVINGKLVEVPLGPEAREVGE